MSASPLTGRTRTIFRAVAYSSLAMILVLLVYALYSLLTQGIGVIGSSLVEVELPPPSLSPIYAKPITLLYIGSLLLLYTGLELGRDRVSRLPDGGIQLLKLAAFGVGAVAFFELAYNLVFWTGVLSAQAVLGHLNPDTIANPFPDLTHPINVVFASKTAAAALLGAAYSFYFLSQVQNTKRA